MGARVKIVWSIERGTPITGIRGIDYEMVPVEDLVKWAKRRRRQLRRDMNRGTESLRRRAEREAARGGDD